MATQINRLTETGVARIKPGPARREVPDGGGLYLVVQPSGQRSWAVRYRRDGVPRKHTIGPYPAVRLKAARELAKAALESVARGADPAADKKQARVAAKEQDTTLARVMPLFLDRYTTRKNRRPKARSLEELARLFGLRRKDDSWEQIKGGLAARWGKRKVTEITRADIVGLLDDIVKGGTPVKANRMHGALHLFFAWCIKRGMVAENPCAGMDRPGAEQSRDRTLSDDELRWFWQATEGDAVFGPLFRLLALTGQRRDEVRGMTWREVDIDGKLWTIPAARTKNGREHQVPLSDAALAILKAQKRIKGKAGLVFTTNGETAISGISRAKARAEAEMLRIAREDDAAATIERWTLHDLRRTAATGMAKLGISVPVIEKVLNHASGTFGGIVGVYQHHDFAEEKRTALDAWGDFVTALAGKASSRSR